MRQIRRLRKGDEDSASARTTLTTPEKVNTVLLSRRRARGYRGPAGRTGRTLRIEENHRKYRKWIVRIGAGVILFFILVLMIIIGSDQLRTPAPPRPILPEPVRAVLEHAVEQNAQIAGRAAATGNSLEGAFPGKDGKPLNKDQEIEKFINSLLPFKDLSKVSPENQEAARKWNASVSKALADLVDLLQTSPQMSFEDAYWRRYFAVFKNLEDSAQTYSKDVSPEISESEAWRLISPVCIFLLESELQIKLDHKEYLVAGALCADRRNWEGTVYCWQRAGLKGRVLLAKMSLSRFPDRVYSAWVQAWSDDHTGR